MSPERHQCSFDDGGDIRSRGLFAKFTSESQITKRETLGSVGVESAQTPIGNTREGCQ